MKRAIRLILVAATLSLAGVGATATPVAASCASDHITLYVDTNGGGSGTSFCLTGGVGNQPNLNNITGPCPQFLHADSWNDCASSVRVSLTSTQCFALYRDANYSTLIVKYWGSIGPDTLFNLPSNDSLTSMKQYTKTPATPAGNC